jgi:mannose-6-phosphate isomerase-like protein (cupin superfamily)
MDPAELRRQFEELGYAGPIPLLTKEECEECLQPQNAAARPPLWSKALAVSNPHFHQLACRKELLPVLNELLGENILLWGSRLVHKGPGVEHPWHSDIECLTDDGKAATLWIGLNQTTSESALHVISHSHLFQESLQEVAFKSGKERTGITTDDVLLWAQERDPHSRLVRFDITDGDVLFLNRRLWHYSKNTTDKKRTALLLQYCTPDAEIRMPSNKEYQWPFHFSQQRPPCLLISGTNAPELNGIVDPPGTASDSECVIQAIDALQYKWRKSGWRSGSVFKSVDAQTMLTSHVSILQKGSTPHEPHIHEDEELLILLSGEVDIIRGNNGNTFSERLKPGSFVYHPAYQSHTLTSVGPGPATYLMFKWKGEAKQQGEPILNAGTFDIWQGTKKYRSGWRRIVQIQSPTLYLMRLNAHLSILSIAGGYEPHADPYDVAIVVLSGQVKTLGHQIGPNCVVFYPANQVHGMKNVGNEKAVYLVFEFHWNRTQQKAAAARE